MDHITRCPNCATAFRVTDAQLTTHQGRVRCGRCALVFNARENLLSSSSARQGKAHDSFPSEFAHPIPDAPGLQEQAEQSTAAGSEEIAHAPVESRLMSPPASDGQSPAPAPHMAEISSMEITSDQPSYRPIIIPEDDALFAPLPKPRHAVTWLFFTALAALALIVQILFAYRATLAMEFPALQPRLAVLCTQLGCEMPLPRQADRLRLEWSELTFVPDHPNLIQLSATLRNLAQYEQALPLLELTLTDNQERIVARRVFKPSEYLAGTEKHRESLRAHDELHAFLQLEIGNLKSTGYSLYWFYE